LLVSLQHTFVRAQTNSNDPCDCQVRGGTLRGFPSRRGGLVGVAVVALAVTTCLSGFFWQPERHCFTMIHYTPMVVAGGSGSASIPFLLFSSNGNDVSACMYVCMHVSGFRIGIREDETKKVRNGTGLHTKINIHTKDSQRTAGAKRTVAWMSPFNLSTTVLARARPASRDEKRLSTISRSYRVGLEYIYRTLGYIEHSCSKG
jgi:hypothetical protein